MTDGYPLDLMIKELGNQSYFKIRAAIAELVEVDPLFGREWRQAESRLDEWCRAQEADLIAGMEGRALDEAHDLVSHVYVRREPYTPEWRRKDEYLAFAGNQDDRQLQESGLR